MLLALDVGNTNVTIGVYDREELLFVSRMATDSARMEDQYAIELLDILGLHKVDREAITGAVLSSVVPKLTEYISAAVKRIFGFRPLVVSYESLEGLKISIRHPETTGPDLIAGYVAAKELYGCPCIVIDMGTATTITVIDKEGALLGGGIVPGVGISLDALTSRAALLSSISLDTPAHVIGRDTVECLQSGMVYGTASMLDGFCDRIEEELGYPCRVVATGGLAGQVVRCCRRKVELSDTLLLDGLKLIYDREKH
ncbi:MAG TPA: type III pantothenate kinase [Candidatus Acutalibacter pullistercoris]|uniref:Type III pantothenate kinase n=1 Tax=Candidatus Acutalibacter pullistercoris TaxID=2838418 RepID=A0A9D2BZV0_9FIRM|nr:type III pantothenate kinase [Candidatus Acutalibacter pullistercoris]